MNPQLIVWLIALVFFLVIELSTVSLVTIWFAAGSLAGLIAAALGGPLWLQVTLFLSVSVVLLACLRRFVRRFIHPGITATNVDSVVGREGVVTLSIDNGSSQGQIRLGSMEWSARSTSGAVIEPGTRVRVDRIEGVRAFVSPAEVPAHKS